MAIAAPEIGPQAILSPYQKKLCNYLGAVLVGEPARQRGAPPLALIEGTLQERRYLGGIFVATILHYHKSQRLADAPTRTALVDQVLWVQGHQDFQLLNNFREPSTGRLRDDASEQIANISPLSDPRIAYGEALYNGLHLRGLKAEFVAQDVLLALRYKYGRGDRLIGASAA